MLSTRFLAASLIAGTIFVSSCASERTLDKHVLQILNQEGFGKRYVGNAQDENYITIGDTIQYVDTYNEGVTGSEIVDIDGTIQLPEVGPVFVAGMTRAEVETYLTQKLTPYFTQSDVKVNLRSGGGKVLYVIGEVGNPGPRAFRGDTTVFEAVLLAQPEEFTANLGRVKVIRADPRNPTIIPVNVADLWETGDSTYNIQLQEFDIVYVPPTLLKQFADILSGIIVPVISPFRAVIQTIFFWNRGGNRNRFNNRGVF